MIELFLYDTEKVKREEDDPRSAIIFHHPLELADKDVLLRAGHLASLYLASLAFIGVDKKEPATFKLSRGGACRIFSLAHQRFLMISVAFQPPPDEKEHLGVVEEWSADLKSCLLRLFSDDGVDLPTQRAVHLPTYLSYYCATFGQVSVSKSCLSEKVEVGVIFQQIHHLFATLDIAYQWVAFHEKVDMLRCHSISLSDKEIWWLTSLKESSVLWQCHGRHRKTRPGTNLLSLKDFDYAWQCSFCQNKTEKSLADRIRGGLFKQNEPKLMKDDCWSLYLQWNNDCTLGMIFHQCPNQIEEETLNALWTTCLGKMSSLNSKRPALSSSHRSRRKRAK